jgi:hypothetical protein
MKDMQQGIARKMGGIAMTRHSITAVLALLLVGLLVAVNAPAISAADINGGGSAPLTVSGDAPCILDNQGNCAAREALVSVASVGPAVAVSASSIGDAPSVNRICFFTYDDVYTCNLFASDGMWVRTEAFTAGAWTVTAQMPTAALAAPLDALEATNNSAPVRAASVGSAVAVPGDDNRLVESDTTASPVRTTQDLSEGCVAVVQDEPVCGASAIFVSSPAPDNVPQMIP